MSVSTALRLPYCFDCFLNVARWSLFASWEQNFGERDRATEGTHSRTEAEMEIGERERDRRDGKEGDTPFGRECDCLMKTAEPTKPKHSAVFKAVVLRLRSCPSDAGTLVFRITFKANFYFSFCFCLWQKAEVNQVDH